MGMIGYPVTDEELDSLEGQAMALVQAVEAGDHDSAYIIAQTSNDPALLAMFAVEVALQGWEPDDE